jgi:hypothetical protein
MDLVYLRLADFLLAMFTAVVALLQAFSGINEYLSLGGFDMGKPKA